MRRFLHLAAAAAVALLLASLCGIAIASTPEPTLKTIRKEVKIGAKAAAEVEKQMPRVLDPSEEAKLAMIGDKLAPYMTRPLSFDIRIVSDDQPNAFSLPGGRTYVTTAMLGFLKSKDEFAAVLAHEFVHADRAHGIIQAARNNRLSLLTIAGIIAATQGAGPGAMLMGSALQTAIMNSYSIDLEKEADARGIDAMYKAGFNPAAMLTMMERLETERMKHPYYEPGIMQTHPDYDERINAALKFMKDRNINVQRKDVLKRLKLDVVSVSGDARLTVDGAALLSVKESEEGRTFLKTLAERLDPLLELELAPYDIYIGGSGPDEALMIKGRTVLKRSELIEGIPELSIIRNRINDAVLNARMGSPLTDYFQ